VQSTADTHVLPIASSSGNASRDILDAHFAGVARHFDWDLETIGQSTAAFLALKGLFTAHVTGKFVTLGASLVLGTSGALAKLLALPVFCAVVILARLLAHGLRVHSRPVMRTMLTLQLAFFTAGALLAAWLGPFADGDGYAALVTGMTLVAAMAIQNAAHRVHLASAPPSTIMTGRSCSILRM
jgi:uncharacterized membrane protein YoaK (UPF0700 family)